MQFRQKLGHIALVSVLLIVGLSITASLGLAQGDYWAQLRDMPRTRWALRTGVVNGKIIYVIGGTGGSRKVEEYDPETDTWTEKADMPTGRTCFSASAANGKIYAIGGFSEKGGPSLSIVEEYDPEADVWTTERAPMLTARQNFSTSVVNGKIYAIGGYVSGDEPPLSTVEEYDPATDSWTAKANMPTARCWLSTSVVKGKIYAIGGNATSDAFNAEPLSIVEEYDPETDTWTTGKAPMPTARFGLAASAVNGIIYALGGSETSSWQDYSSTVEVYYPTTAVESTSWGRIKSLFK